LKLLFKLLKLLGNQDTFQQAIMGYAYFMGPLFSPPWKTKRKRMGGKPSNSSHLFLRKHESFL